jgi:hypothetical protein
LLISKNKKWQFVFQASLTKPATSFSSHDIASLSLGETTYGVSSKTTSGGSSSSTSGGDWFITFEQFLASVLNESALVNFFDQRVDIVAK